MQWHLGFFAEDYTPNRRGFDSFYGYYTGCEDYFDHTYAAGYPDHVSIIGKLGPCFVSSEELCICL